MRTGSTSVRVLTVGALVVALITVSIVSIIQGQVPLSLSDVGAALTGSATGADTEFARTVVFDIRLPRLMMALGVGVGLAVSGVLMQSLFANPLAEPGVVGVSSGAAMGAALAIAFGATALGQVAVSLAAFAGALAISLLVVAVSRSAGRIDVVMLLLTGIALNALAGAVIALILFSTSSAAREQIVFWQFGSLNGAQWSQVVVLVPVVIVGTIVALTLAKQLDLMSLGYAAAGHAGVNVSRTRLMMIVTVSIAVGVSVAFAGIIGFVGLVVPHVMRLLVGPSHLILTVASALGGAVLVAVSDLIARTVVPFGDLPIGMVTAFIGAPIFLWLIRKIMNGKATGLFA